MKDINDLIEVIKNLGLYLEDDEVSNIGKLLLRAADRLEKKLERSK